MPVFHPRVAGFLIALIAPLALAQEFAVPVDAEMPQRQTMPETLQVAGSLHASEQVQLASEVAGKVASLGFSEGQAVAAGDVLVTLDDALFKADSARAQASFELARLQHERNSRLLQQRAISAAAHDESRAALDEARAALELVNVRLAKTQLTAPFAGTAGLREVSVGDFVDIGQTLLTVANDQPLRLEFQIPERWITRVGTHTRIRFEAGGISQEAQISALHPAVDLNSRSLRALALIENADLRLKSGMFARVQIVVGDDTPMLTIPEQALMASRMGYQVFVVENGQAKLRSVRVGRRDQGRASILEGLDEHLPVITAGHMKLFDGAPVAVRGSEGGGA